MKDSSGQTWFSTNLSKIDWSKEKYYKNNTIGILEKDVISFLDGINDKTPNNMAMKNFQKALLKGLRNIPNYSKNS